MEQLHKTRPHGENGTAEELEIDLDAIKEQIPDATQATASIDAALAESEKAQKKREREEKVAARKAERERERKLEAEYGRRRSCCGCCW